MTSPIRLVVDTNIIGSTLLGGQTAAQFATLIQATDRIDLIYDDRLLEEVSSLASVPYFQQRGITAADISDFLDIYQAIAIKVLVTSQVRVGRDRNDHFLLSLGCNSKLRGPFSKGFGNERSLSTPVSNS